MRSKSRNDQATTCTLVKIFFHTYSSIYLRLFFVQIKVIYIFCAVNTNMLVLIHFYANQ